MQVRIGCKMTVVQRKFPPCSAEVKHDWSYTSAPPMWLHGMGSDNFLLLFMTTSMKIPSSFGSGLM